MKYYRFTGESDLGYEIANHYMEVDEQRDFVTRQIENYRELWRHGYFDGKKAVGYITDRYASELDFTESEEISRTEFEQMWERAGGPINIGG